jgi:UDP-glucose 6-dehydrogenase
VQAEDGSCDLSQVHSTFEWLNVPLVILKSTVEVGTTEKLRIPYKNLNIVFSPEFAGESTYWSEYKFHNSVVETPWFIFGGDRNDTTKAIDIYMKIAGPTKRYRQTTATEAEMTKYITNTFYATKIAFCYEMAELCKAAGIDYNEVRSLWLEDPRINPMHTAVFEENDFPFSGKCVVPDSSLIVNGKLMTIKDAYDMHDHSKTYKTPSCNYNITQPEMKEISNITERKYSGKMIKIETDVGNFICTPEHLMPIKRNSKMKIVQAKDISDTDEIFSMDDFIKN